MRRAALAVIVLAAAATGLLLRTSGGARSPNPQLRATMVEVGDLKLRVVRAGDQRAPAVIMLHGYGESLVSWRGVFDRLAASSDAIALDLPGFGLSSKPASGYSTDSLARVVLAVMDAAGIRRASLVGHSMGGAVAAATALLMPDRVSALVLIAPAGVAAPWVGPDSLPVIVRTAVAEYEVQRTRFTSPHDLEWLREEPPLASYLPASDTAYRQALSAVLQEFDFEWLTPERASRLRQPTLILWGELDQVLPVSHGHALAAAIPNSRFEVIARSWHRPQVERPADTAARIADFLAHLDVSAVYH